MTRTHEKLLVGVLAGIIIAGAAAFAIEPSLAGHGMKATSTVSYDVLTLKLTSRA